MDEMKADALEASFEAVEMAGLPPVRPMLAGGRPIGSAAFESFLRAGGGIEIKALTGTSDAAGGYAIPEEIDGQIDATLKSISPIRAIANVVKVGTSGYRKLVTSGGFESGWAAETAARDETDTPVFNEVAPPFGDLYANPAASQAMLDDAAFDVEQWLAGEVAREFAVAEGGAFVNGNGVNKPKGFLAVPTSVSGDGTRAFGTLQYLASGAAGAFAANPEDKLIDLVQSLRAPYRQGASWVMNSATLAKIRKFKTSDGAFLWAPGLGAGQPTTLLGYPVVEAEDMPDIAANSLSIAFGNFKAGYLIAERGETQVLRDPYSNKPFVHFYATPRLALPLLQPGQAQKEMSHNEALARLDLVVQGAVVAADMNIPPSTPAAGEAWILGSSPTGAWSSHSLSVAGWTDSGWIFIEPAPGMQLWVIAEAAPATFVEGMWRLGEVRGKVFVEGDQVVGPRAAGIAEPTAGTTVDAEARAAIVSVLEVLRGHGLIESD